MASFFGGMPQPKAQPLTPFEDPAAQKARDAEAEAENRRRQASGRASNILTSPLGDTGSASTSAAKLLGL